MSTSLHELLPVRESLKTAKNNALAMAGARFTRATHQFVGFVKRYLPFSETEAETESVEELSELDANVPQVLSDLTATLGRFLDVSFYVDMANTDAADDNVGLGDLPFPLPAPFLLTMETELLAFRKAVEAAPVHPPGKKWVADSSLGSGVFRQENQEVTFRTRKEPKSKIIVEATEHHPAQAQTWSEDVRIGKYETLNFSGALAPARKALLLARLDALIQNVKSARQRANAVTLEATPAIFGRKLTEYLLAD